MRNATIGVHGEVQEEDHRHAKDPETRREDIPRMAKADVAERVLDAVVALLE